MPTECEICFEEKGYINPCGALNNCKARVCGKCLAYSNFKRVGIWNVSDDNIKCPFCKCIDCKKPFMMNFVDDVLQFQYFDNWDKVPAPFGGDGWNKTSYIAFLTQLRYNLQFNLSKKAFEEMPFCVPCDLKHSVYDIDDNE